MITGDYETIVGKPKTEVVQVSLSRDQATRIATFLGNIYMKDIPPEVARLLCFLHKALKIEGQGVIDCSGSEV